MFDPCVSSRLALRYRNDIFVLSVESALTGRLAWGSGIRTPCETHVGVLEIVKSGNEYFEHFGSG